MADGGTWHIIHIDRTERGLQYTGKKIISEQEKDSILANIRMLTDFFASQNVVRGVIANRDELMQALVGVDIAYKTNPVHARAIMENANADLSRRLANVCSLFRSFLDHFDNYFKNHCEENSDDLKAWSSSKRREYDTHLSYRIMDLMRNYIQHRDMPPLKISASEKIDKMPVIKVFVDCLELSKDRKISDKLKKTGYPLPNQIEMKVVIDEWSRSANDIVALANQLRARRILPAAKATLGIREELNVGGFGELGIIYLPHVELKPETISLNVNYIEEAMAAAIVVIAAGEDLYGESGDAPTGATE